SRHGDNDVGLRIAAREIWLEIEELDIGKDTEAREDRRAPSCRHLRAEHDRRPQRQPARQAEQAFEIRLDHVAAVPTTAGRHENTRRRAGAWYSNRGALQVSAEEGLPRDGLG